MTLLTLRPRRSVVAAYRLPVGRVLPLSVSAVDARGHAVDAPLVAWRSSDVGVVIIEGPDFAARAVSAGAAVVTAQLGSLVAALRIDTTTPQLRVAIRPGAAR